MRLTIRGKIVSCMVAALLGFCTGGLNVLGV